MRARREEATGASVQTRYYISSLEAPASILMEAIRSHWSIENSLHWSLDVTFQEDQCRVRKDHGPQNMAVLRQIALNMLKKETAKNAASRATPTGRLGGRLPPENPHRLRRDCPDGRRR